MRRALSGELGNGGHDVAADGRPSPVRLTSVVHAGATPNALRDAEQEEQGALGTAVAAAEASPNAPRRRSIVAGLTDGRTGPAARIPSPARASPSPPPTEPANELDFDEITARCAASIQERDQLAASYRDARLARRRWLNKQEATRRWGMIRQMVKARIMMARLTKDQLDLSATAAFPRYLTLRSLISKPPRARSKADITTMSDIIKHLKYFRQLGLTMEQRMAVTAQAKLINYRTAGMTVFEQGDPGDCFYVVVAGRVSVTITTEVPPSPDAASKPGGGGAESSAATTKATSPSKPSAGTSPAGRRRSRRPRFLSRVAEEAKAESGDKDKGPAAAAVKRVKEVAQLFSGDAFGEGAFLNVVEGKEGDAKRGAGVSTIGPTQLMQVPKSVFFAALQAPTLALIEQKRAFLRSTSVFVDCLTPAELDSMSYALHFEKIPVETVLAMEGDPVDPLRFFIVIRIGEVSLLTRALGDKHELSVATNTVGADGLKSYTAAQQEEMSRRRRLRHHGSFSAGPGSGPGVSLVAGFSEEKRHVPDGSVTMCVIGRGDVVTTRNMLLNGEGALEEFTVKANTVLEIGYISRYDFMARVSKESKLRMADALLRHPSPEEMARLREGSAQWKDYKEHLMKETVITVQRKARAAGVAQGRYSRGSARTVPVTYASKNQFTKTPRSVLSLLASAKSTPRDDDEEAGADREPGESAAGADDGKGAGDEVQVGEALLHKLREENPHPKDAQRAALLAEIERMESAVQERRRTRIASRSKLNISSNSLLSAKMSRRGMVGAHASSDSLLGMQERDSSAGMVPRLSFGLIKPDTAPHVQKRPMVHSPRGGLVPGPMPMLPSIPQEELEALRELKRREHILSLRDRAYTAQKVYDSVAAKMRDDYVLSPEARRTARARAEAEAESAAQDYAILGEKGPGRSSAREGGASASFGLFQGRALGFVNGEDADGEGIADHNLRPLSPGTTTSFLGEFSNLRTNRRGVVQAGFLALQASDDATFRDGVRKARPLAPKVPALASPGSRGSTASGRRTLRTLTVSPQSMPAHLQDDGGLFSPMRTTLTPQRPAKARARTTQSGGKRSARGHGRGRRRKGDPETPTLPTPSVAPGSSAAPLTPGRLQMEADVNANGGWVTTVVD